MGEKMTKAEIVEQIYEQVGFSKKESADLVEKVFETIKETLARGEKVKISGFGNFVVRGKNARKGRNPQTGQEILLEARRVLTFKPSLVLKTMLNDQGTGTHKAEEKRASCRFLHAAEPRGGPWRVEPRDRRATTESIPTSVTTGSERSAPSRR